MKLSTVVILSFFYAATSLANQSGDAKSNLTAACAACHGESGVSVADHIPNLAGQRAPYLKAQLTAFKEGSRKSEIMGGIAAQLSGEEIGSVASHFASQSAANGGTKSAFLPSLANTRLVFPDNYKLGFRRYHIQNEPESKRVKVYLSNTAARNAAMAGKQLPDRSAIFIEVYSAQLDERKQPIKDKDGYFVPDKLLSYTAMARNGGWGEDVPELIRNENWNYAIFSRDRKLNRSINQAECLACHKPAKEMSYVFTLKELAGARM